VRVTALESMALEWLSNTEMTYALPSSSWSSMCNGRPRAPKLMPPCGPERHLPLLLRRPLWLLQAVELAVFRARMRPQERGLR
jgi:hypothetical protein